MILIIGLGNPGPKYETTRHNIGFMVVDRLADHRKWEIKSKFQAAICQYSPEVLLVKPQTFMNHSGIAVSGVSDFYQIPSANMWVVHDDIDLPLGKIRIRRGGASAGHNGINSLLEHLGSEAFVRFRLGVGRGKLALKKSADQNLHRRAIEKFVTSPFASQYEEKEAHHLVKIATDSLSYAIEKGIERAMHKFN